MSQSDPFITFPISALRMPVSPAAVTADEGAVRATELRLLSVITGTKHLTSESFPQALIATGEVVDSLPEWLAESDDLAALSASMRLHRLNGDVLCGISSADHLQAVCDDLARRLIHTSGKKLCRIRMDILDDLEDGEMTWRQFAVLTAVYASCSASKPAPRLVRDQLIAMASGWTGHHVARAAGADCRLMLTTSQVRTTLDELHEMRFFARVSLGRRSYFSSVMAQHELEEVVARIEAKRSVPIKRAASKVAQRVRERAAQITEFGQAESPNASPNPSPNPSPLPEKLSSGEALFRKSSFPEKQSGRTFFKSGGPSVLPSGQFVATHNEFSLSVEKTSTMNPSEEAVSNQIRRRRVVAERSD